MERFRHGLLVLFMTAFIAPAAVAQIPLDAAFQKIERMISPPGVVAAVQSFRLVERLAEARQGEEWTPATRTTFTYQGQMAVSEDFVNLEGTWKQMERTTYRLVNGRLLTELIETWDDETNAYVPQTRFEYNFLSAVAISQITEQHWDGTAWANEMRTSFDINSSGDVESALYEQWEEAWVPVERHLFEADGDDVVFTEQSWQDGAWINERRARFLLQTRNSLQEALEELAGRIDLYGAILLAFRLPDYESRVWDGEDWVDEQRQVSENWYDFPSGRLLRTESVTSEWEDGQWVDQLVQDLEYDEDGLPKLLVFRVLDDEESAITLSERYEHDQNRLLISAEQGMVFLGMDMLLARHTFTWAPDTGTNREEETVARIYALDPAYPNPFNPMTTLGYRTEAAGLLSIRVYDILGRHVQTLFDGLQSAGTHTVAFDAAGLPSGIYLIRMEAPGFAQSRKVMLLK
jgi:hypothetical protein